MPSDNNDIGQLIPGNGAPDRPGTEDLVSVIVTCCGQLEYTRLCVPSVLRYSRQPFELVFVDMASLDGTAEYLAGVAAAASVPVSIVHTGPETSFGAACNQGIARSRGQFLVVLSNDTIVTDNWLNQLVALSNLDPSIGLVGPMCNCAPEPQGTASPSYRLRSQDGFRSRSEIEAALDAVNSFARGWRDTHRGEWLQTERLAAFCFLTKRSVLQAIGHFNVDSALALSGDELCQRVRRAGYRLACCRDLYVHHAGSRVIATKSGPAL